MVGRTEIYLDDPIPMQLFPMGNNLEIRVMALSI